MSDLQEVRTFVAVYEAGGFSAAASVLNRSQPAISRRVSQLEARLGVRLIERIGQSVALTSAGRAYLPRAKSLLAAVADAERTAQELRSGDVGAFVLAVVGTLANEGLAGILHDLRKAFPGVTVKIETDTSNGVSQRISAGHADIGIRYYASSENELANELVGTEKLRVICSSEHPLAGTVVDDLSPLIAETWLVFPSRDAGPARPPLHLVSAFRATGYDSFNWSAIDSLTAQKRMVEAGYGLALMPENALQDELGRGGLSTIDVRGLDMTYPVYVVSRENGYFSPYALAFCTAVRTSGAW